MLHLKRTVSYTSHNGMQSAEDSIAKKDPVRVVMWDMTNIPGYAFSDADLNRFTSSGTGEGRPSPMPAGRLKDRQQAAGQSAV